MTEETAQYTYSRVFINGDWKVVRTLVPTIEDELAVDLELRVENESVDHAKYYMKQRGMDDKQISLLLSIKELRFCENVAIGNFSTVKECAVKAGYTDLNAARICKRLLEDERIKMKLGELQWKRWQVANIKADELIVVQQEIRDRALNAVPVTKRLNGEVVENGEWECDLATANSANKFLAQLSGIWNDSSTLNIKIHNEMSSMITWIYNQGTPAFQIEFQKIIEKMQGLGNEITTAIAKEVIETHVALTDDSTPREEITKEEYERMILEEGVIPFEF